MLPTCPACGQSVLDDDAAECPFCGASMSGKPGKKKPAAKPLATKPEDPRPKKKAKPKPKSDDAENPFETAPVQTAAAIQAAPKPMKGRLMKVVCPMCDTPGFVPKKAAGRDIRCANKKCMVPVFPAPAPKRVAVDQEPPPAGSPVGAIIGAVVALAVVGGVVFMMLGKDAPVEEEKKVITNKGPDAAARAKELAGRTKKKEDDGVKGPVTLAALRDEVLEKLADAAHERNNDKPFCRRMTAESYAAAGQLDKALEQVALISKPREPKFYQRAFALSHFAWAAAAAGDATRAKKAVADAVVASAQLPKFGRTEFDVRTSVAAAMAGTGQLEEAIEFANQSTRDLSDELTLSSAAASAQAAIAIAFEDSPGDLVPQPAIAGWSNPTWVATALVLCAHGKANTAAQWAAKAPDSPARADALAAVAGYAAAAKQSAIVASAVRSAAVDGPASSARVNGAAAMGAAVAKQTAAAAAALTAAETALAQLPEPAPVAIRNARELYEYAEPEQEPLVMAAKAAAEVARAQAEINGGGEGTLLTAIRHAQSFCPPPAFIEERLQENITAQQLASALNIGEAQARTTLIKFKAKLKTLSKSGEQRTELIADFLGRVAASKLGDSVWKLADPKAEKNLLSSELLERSELPWKVASAFLRNGRVADARVIVQQVGESAQPALEAEIQSYLNTDTQPQRVGNLLSPPRDSNPDRLRVVYAFAKKYAANDAVSATTFATSLGNAAWRREALRIVGTRLARIGHGRKLVEIVDGLDLEPPDRTAIYRGFISGVRLDPEFKSPPPAK